MATTAVLISLILIMNSLSATSVAALLPPLPNTSLITTILSTLGFHDAAASAVNLPGATPVTIFAPTDSSILTCPSCSIPLLLQEYSLLGLYPLHFLGKLAFGTKIESLAANRCLTVTSSSTSTSTSAVTQKIFINGVEVTKPDLFNNGLLIVHGLQGFVSHLSPFSCSIESMTSLSFPQQPPPMETFFIMRLMLKDAMARLRISGYNTVALALRVKYSELSDLKSMTLFAIDDESIFGGRGGGGHAYVAELGFHIVPNMLLPAAELLRLPAGMALPTMERDRNLVVTSAGGGGPLAPMRINYVKVQRLDMVYNNRIVVHGVSFPFHQ